MLFRAKKIKRITENIRINLRVDLHGMTQDEAFKTLKSCVRVAVQNNDRNILIITGKSGVLHDIARRWLEQNSFDFPEILKTKNAPVNLGGDGAFIAILKKSKINLV
jgi:DNA-nicking Smr family endonuclease